jgi:hypothetical protein
MCWKREMLRLRMLRRPAPAMQAAAAPTMAPTGCEQSPPAAALAARQSMLRDAGVSHMAAVTAVA